MGIAAHAARVASVAGRILHAASVPASSARHVSLGALTCGGAPSLCRSLAADLRPHIQQTLLADTSVGPVAGRRHPGLRLGPSSLMRDSPAPPRRARLRNRSNGVCSSITLVAYGQRGEIAC